MKIFEYYNYKGFPEIFFITYAHDLKEADANFEKELGKHPVKLNHIALRIYTDRNYDCTFMVQQ